jgi:hypothetical protein
VAWPISGLCHILCTFASSCAAVSEYTPSRCSNLRLRAVLLLRFEQLHVTAQATGATERIVLEVVIDFSFNQSMAMRSLRACQNTQGGQAGSKAMYSSSRESPHEQT